MKDEFNILWQKLQVLVFSDIAGYNTAAGRDCLTAACGEIVKNNDIIVTLLQ